jgi:hypothetical protein
MHLIGTWRCSPRGRPGDFPLVDLRTSDAVTVLENEWRKLVYAGVIFDAGDRELLSDPTLLDKAFGYYTYALFDKRAGTIDIGTDRLGYSPLYFAWERGIFRFSSSSTLLKYELESATPNFDAWDETLHLGDILGEKTLVKEIRRLRSGKKFRMTADRVDQIEFWQPELPEFTDKESYIRVNNELLLEAVRLTSSCQAAKFVMLSGGQDSRRLAVAAHHAGLPATCITQESVGKRGFDENMRLAAAVCELLGLPHIRVPRSGPREHYNDTIMMNYWLSYETPQHDWVVPLFRCLPKGALVYDGIVADVTVNGHYFRAYPEIASKYDDLDFTARLICGTGGSGVDPRLVSAPLFERVRAELALYPQSPHRLTFYFLFNHTRRSIGSWYNLLQAYGHTPCLPYLYYPFLVQSLSLEPKHYFSAWMQSECMAEMNSRAAAIPSTRDKVPAEYLLDLTGDARSRRRFDAAHLRSRPDAVRLFPGLKRSLSIFKVMSRLGLSRFAGAWSWAPTTLARFSEFQDWIEDRAPPAFPVATERSAFLERHFVDRQLRGRTDR